MEDEFCKFYSEVTKVLQEVKDLDDKKLSKLVLPLPKMKGKVEKVCKNKNRKNPPAPLHKFSYLYECCTCTSIVIANHFRELMESDSHSTRKILQRQNINICCLPGTPGSEAVSFIKLFTRKWGRSWDNEVVHMKFHISFVDVDDGWKEISEIVLETLRELNGAWHIPEVTFSFEKVAAFLPIHAESVKVFQSADIVFTVKSFLDISDIAKKTFDELLKLAFQNMKVDSLFYCLDSSSGDYIKQLNSMLKNLPLFHSVYQHPYDKHSLNIHSIQEHVNLYKYNFGRDLNTDYCMASAAAWIRASKYFTRPSENEKIERLSDKSLSEKSKRIKVGKTAQFSTKPSAPCGPLTVEEVCADRVKLKWKEPEDTGGHELISFVVEKTDEETGRWVLSGRVGPNADTFIAAGLASKTKYNFRVKAVNNDGESPALVTQKAIQTKELCSLLIAEEVGTNYVKLKWVKAKDIDGQELECYVVEKMDEVGFWKPTGQVAPNENSYTVTDLKPKRRYHFRVNAVNKSGKSTALVMRKAIKTKNNYENFVRKTNAEQKKVRSKSCFDVRFSVKSEKGSKSTFVANKQLLSTKSPVFAEMFKSPENKGKDVIDIVVCDIEAFKFMICYLHGLEPDCKCHKLLLEVFKLAKEYKIEDLQRNIASHFYSENVIEDNITHIWNVAVQFHSNYLRTKCIKVLLNSAVLKSKDIHNIPPSLITALLSMEWVSLQSEYELIKLVFWWAKANYVKNLNCPSMREILEEMLPYLKFTDLSCEQFSKLIENYKLVFEDFEAFSIFMNIACSGSYPLPPWVNAKIVTRTFLNEKLS